MKKRSKSEISDEELSLPPGEDTGDESAASGTGAGTGGEEETEEMVDKRKQNTLALLKARAQAKVRFLSLSSVFGLSR